MCVCVCDMEDDSGAKATPKSPSKASTTPRRGAAANSGMESPAPASAHGVASPRGHLARSAGKKITYVDDVSDMEDGSEFELSDADAAAEEEDDDFSDAASEDDEAADKKRKKAAAARKAKAKKRTKVGLVRVGTRLTHMN